MKPQNILMALAGQPNCGKSTVFNSLTGANQHVANYPGVTVEKMYGAYKKNGKKVEVVDLPGTYSLTSYSPEEKVTRNFLLHDNPSVVVNVMDASNLKRNLYLTFQLIEMEVPVILNLNMMDVADRRGIEIDINKLKEELGITVIPSAIKTGRGRKELFESIDTIADKEINLTPIKIDYKSMETFLDEIITHLSSVSDDLDYPLRWLAIKLMEGDEEAIAIIKEKIPNSSEILTFAEQQRKNFEEIYDERPERHIAFARYRTAEEISRNCFKIKNIHKVTLSDQIDKIVCNKFLGPLILIGIVYALYHLSIVEGYKVTHYTWPLLAKIKSITSAIMPQPGFISEPIIRSLALWFVDSINALLNYIPIFLILFALIAILEDTGYMPRMAFLLDRIFKRFGLHGQSTLPMVLGGIYVGGCAVPAVMSTKGIPDEKARLATMLIIPMLNCLAKIPLYILLINIYFSEHKSIAMMFMATITILMALPVAKILSMTVLKNKESAPFIMEMPPYHLPTIRGVLGRAIERVWLFVKKIITIVAAVAVIIFILIQFPGLNKEKQNQFNSRAENARQTFFKKIQNTPYGNEIQNNDQLMSLILFSENYKTKKMGVKTKEKSTAINEKFMAENSVFFKIIKPKKDKQARKVNRELKQLISVRKEILREIKAEKINNSFLGQIGKSLEPVTQWAGFNWRVNVALLSAFAAKESSVATLGALYQSDEDGEALESRMKEKETTFTPLHALSLLLVMALFPPCIATVITIKLQSNSTKLMLFSMAYQMLLGFVVASIVFTGSMALGLTGLQAMSAFFVFALLLTIVTGIIPDKKNVYLK